MADPVGSRSGPIMAHMNKDHVNEMTTIISQRVQLDRPPQRARMTAIDANGFTLEYRVVRSLFANASGDRKTLHVAFSPAIKESSEIRQRIIDLSNEAKAKKPKKYATAYSFSRSVPVWLFIYGTMLLIGRPDLSSQVFGNSSDQFVNRALDFVRSYLPSGASTMAWALKWLVTIHVGEATLASAFYYSRGARGIVLLQWFLSHSITGIPSFLDFQKLNPTIAQSKSH